MEQALLELPQLSMELPNFLLLLSQLELTVLVLLMEEIPIIIQVPLHPISQVVDQDNEPIVGISAQGLTQQQIVIPAGQAVTLSATDAHTYEIVWTGGV
jgi:hypothetical protein